MRIFGNINPNNLKLVLFTGCCLVLISNSTSTGTTDCSSGAWFGSKCQFKCRCGQSSPCDPYTGKCPFDCLRGWFGPACQYRAASSSLPAWASDGNPETCDNNGTQPITAHLSSPMPLSWIMLGARSSDDLDDVMIQYKEKGSFIEKRCPQGKPVRSTSTSKSYQTREIFCHVKEVVTEVTVIGNGVGRLCSIDISLGRNVALKQWIFFTSFKIRSGSYHDMSSRPTSSVVDGLTYPDSSCVLVSAFPQDNKLVLMLGDTNELSTVRLHLIIPKDCCADIENYLGLRLYDDKYKRLTFSLTERHRRYQSYMVVFSLPKTTKISVVMVEKLKDPGEMYLCEIETYGARQQRIDTHSKEIKVKMCKPILQLTDEVTFCLESHASLMASRVQTNESQRVREGLFSVENKKVVVLVVVVVVVVVVVAEAAVAAAAAAVVVVVMAAAA
ncbi:multiple epidermal growth factor-like domains protein 6 [Elysia marginata]|uniref:Multiple epidermal growth factor-like domains protein 6 n=1 Tax=Elysia marginata TaxID=1093978 RepID=A0AAV4G610_9GAST|nr:multiple epidermal growth factor-like domains protein 6 [Elysia marginata]